MKDMSFYEEIQRSSKDYVPPPPKKDMYKQFNEKWRIFAASTVTDLKDAIRRYANQGELYYNIHRLEDCGGHRYAAKQIISVWKEQIGDEFSYEYWGNGACTFVIKWDID